MDRISSLVAQLLDRTGDGIIDTQSEATPGQLATLLGRAAPAEKSPAQGVTVQELAQGITAQAGQQPHHVARFLANALTSAQGGTLDLSGYSALHIAQRLGLAVNECAITPSVFRTAVQRYLKGHPLPVGSPRFVSARPRDDQVNDPYTSSNYRDVQIRHIDLKLTFDLGQRQIQGVATYQLGRVRAQELVLDTRYLDISQVLVHVRGEAQPQAAHFWLEQDRPYLGQPLVIDLPKGADEVTIVYKTGTQEGRRAPALNWLEPQQTLGGKQPFFYTQGQYFHNRGWAPLQDTPTAKTTYRIRVLVPSDLGLRAVASNNQPHHGQPPQPTKEGTYDVWAYEVDRPIASYLLAIAVGDLRPVPVSDRSIVYVEPPLVESVREEYRDYDQWLKIGERFFGPEPFGVLDTTLLPRSFAYAGMENLGLNMNNSFIVTGDRSLMTTAIHEFVHAWFGNLVTNARVEDFWLNEGLTRYGERLIIENVFGEEAYRIYSLLGRAGWERKELVPVGNSHNTCLATRVTNANPDDAVTGTPYEKGYLFAEWLEGRLGKEGMTSFLRKYLDRYRHRTLTTADFARFLAQQTGITRRETDIWFYGPGLPQEAPAFDSKTKRDVDQIAKSWDTGQATEIPGGEKWGYLEWSLFLEALGREEKIPTAAFDALRNRYQMDTRENAPLKGLWYELVAKHKYTPSYPGLRQFLESGLGRIKIILPVYRALMKSGENALAREIWAVARPRVSPITRDSLDPKIK